MSAVETLYRLAHDFSGIEELDKYTVWDTVYVSMTNQQTTEFRCGYGKLPRANQQDLDFLMEFDYRRFYKTRPEWVLRNLITKEYVRRSVVAHGRNGPFTSGCVGLGEVILSRICWSSDPSTSMAWSSIHRGIWEGHKLNITVMEALDGAVGWTDVSDSAYEEIKSIWESRYGEDWEKKRRGGT
jgi:hypothetical protein